MIKQKVSSSSSKRRCAHVLFMNIKVLSFLFNLAQSYVPCGMWDVLVGQTKEQTKCA